ncbi:hypothetical protein G3M48_001673 [Beauveria asiatica]|uniref:Uncharacterized protein n=1 Tax=Beauveria asiatica TaxID=1069075 RepID=A0AAW0RF92_9HYPO
MFEIHGGCGFSKRLLHIFSQVAYCSTRMLQDGKTPVVPVTAEFLYDQLVQMHQWSAEYESWNAAKSRHQPIEWIPQTVKSYVVQEAKQMIEVMAEAWRLAGMVYLQLPRNNHMVIGNIADLVKCISIMPASGTMFIANAPLLQVFFLGLLTTVEEHVEGANAWFEQVIRTPVRSLLLYFLRQSVTPLYGALDRIQSWMDREFPLPSPNVEPLRTISERQPWWEIMVAQVQ